MQTSENVFASPEGAWQSGQTLKDQITQLKQNEKIKAQIEKLEKKLLNEKQFNRQLEIRAEIKKAGKIIEISTYEPFFC